MQFLRVRAFFQCNDEVLAPQILVWGDTRDFEILFLALETLETLKAYFIVLVDKQVLDMNKKNHVHTPN